MRPSLHKVIRPDVVLMFRPKTKTGYVIQPQTSAYGLLLRHLQTLGLSDSLDPVVIDAIPTILINPVILGVPYRQTWGKAVGVVLAIDSKVGFLDD